MLLKCLTSEFEFTCPKTGKPKGGGGLGVQGVQFELDKFEMPRRHRWRCHIGNWTYESGEQEVEIYFWDLSAFTWYWKPCNWIRPLTESV